MAPVELEGGDAVRHAIVATTGIPVDGSDSDWEVVEIGTQSSRVSAAARQSRSSEAEQPAPAAAPVVVKNDPEVAAKVKAKTESILASLYKARLAVKQALSLADTHPNAAIMKH